MKDHLARFVTARLDEDEAGAKGSSPGRRRWRESPWRPAGSKRAVLAGSYPIADYLDEHSGDAAHIARTADPDRVLRGVEAKRRIVETYLRAGEELEAALQRVRAHESLHDPAVGMRALLHDKQVKFATLSWVLTWTAYEWATHKDFCSDWGVGISPMGTTKTRSGE